MLNNNFQFEKDNFVYFNYHAKVQKLIRGGHATGYKFFDEYHGIKPCLVVFFDDGKSFPIRKHRFEEYQFLLLKFDVKNLN